MMMMMMIIVILFSLFYDYHFTFLPTPLRRAGAMPSQRWTKDIDA